MTTGTGKNTRASGHTVTAIILTLNEEAHITRCIRSAQRVADDVLVVDSFSTDDTVSIAGALGARTLRHAAANNAEQMNWALAHGQLDSAWLVRLDADEYLDDQLAAALCVAIENAPSDLGGFDFNRRIRFLGKTIRHGGTAPMWVTRAWRNGWAHSETRWMDEHMVLSRGHTGQLPGYLIDENLKPLSAWVQKHNAYATHEAIDLLDRRHGLQLARGSAEGMNRQARRKRWLKMKVYARLPLLVRPWFYLSYRLYVRLGVLDGIRGIAFHTMQGFWYRLLADAKVLEVERAMRRKGWDAREAIRQVFGIDVGTSTRPELDRS